MSVASFTSDALTGLDAALPDLASVFDTEAVGRMFAREWPVRITKCALVGARYEPGLRCVATYELHVVDRAETASQTFGVMSLSPDGRSLRRFDEDGALPGLATAVDPDVMGRRLASLCPGSVERCTATPIRYRPAERAVVRYGLTTHDGHVAFFGKLCSGASPRTSTLMALHQVAASDPWAPMVPAPLAMLEDLGVLIQPPAEGDLLHIRAFSSSRVDLDLVARFRRLGRALAAFHDNDGPSAPWRPLVADVDEIRACLPAVNQADPGLGARLEAAAGMASVAWAHERASEAAPGHGSMRTDHVHTSATRVTFIDLDGYCRSHRGRDIGSLLAYLRWKGLRQRHHRMVVATGRRAFLSGYARAENAPAEESINAAEAISLLRIAARRFRNLSVREWPEVPVLIDTAVGLLSDGHA